MSSNSKLSAKQKQSRRNWLGQLPRGATISQDGRTTFLCIPNGNITYAYTSVASRDEVKFRRKVGEFYALCQWVNTSRSGFFLPGYWHANDLATLLSD